MIEVVYKDENREVQTSEGDLKLPRNIRQIGQVRGNYKIYMEDYVYTFLGRLASVACQDEEKKGSLAVFTGETRWADGTGYLFIKGAILVECEELLPEHIDLSGTVWTKIQDEQKQYFPEQDILGWYFAFPQMAIEITEILQKIHLQYFGEEKVLMLAEPTEGEEAFFHYENGLMTKVKGYYIYYEKNVAMQEYMVQKNQILKPEFTEKCNDEAVVSFRKIIREKKNKSNETETEVHTSVFSYAATACILLALLAVGTGLYRNYKEFQEIKKSAPVSADTAETDSKKVASADEKKELGEGDWEEVPVTEKVQENAEGSGFVENSSEEAGTEENIGESTMEGAEKNMEKSGDAEKMSTEEIGTEETNTEETSTEETSTEEANAEETRISEFYKQEADERKAKRREALARTTNQSNTATQEGAEIAENGIADRSTENASLEDTGKNMTETSGNVHETYVIRPGDTLYQISIEKYGTMDIIQEICQLNGISENQIIYPGQVIVLP